MGIYLNSMYDLRFNNQGILIGVFGAFITSIYQVLVGKKQKDTGPERARHRFARAEQDRKHRGGEVILP